ncbi:MmoB/DmpM family protein [Acidianus brierleyi]|uniref:Toluene monooxygenase n=1 Tax=Acidianus brierleyi TaxID=41673 RepID=A0A2U9II38_9CREN|nr:MmoB/DmpM family protein [Acidianus brierleyi]AWR95594.1 toluene monooxygenase [Acidianus brierleyi]
MSEELTIENILNKYELTIDKLPPDIVGPVLTKDEIAFAVIEAIAADNPSNFIGVIDRGSYIRVVGERKLILNKDTLERVAGEEIRFPGEIEVRMSAFAGKIEVRGDHIMWYLER